jgi:hypothetical protein
MGPRRARTGTSAAIAYRPDPSRDHCATIAASPQPTTLDTASGPGQYRQHRLRRAGAGQCPEGREGAMVRILALSVVAMVVMLAAGVEAAPYPDQVEGDFVIRDFRFASGESLPELKLHYTTLGRPQRDAAGRIINAVLLLHGTSGTGKNFLEPGLAGELFGSGQPLDASRYYIVLPDGIGRGGSSKPSDGLHARFPRYGYNDVVEGQYRLVTEGLKIEHLHLVLGTSMGGMQTWMCADADREPSDADRRAKPAVPEGPHRVDPP